MHFDTPQSLLDRLREENSTADWEVFYDIYRPLIQKYFSHFSVASSDLDDMIHDVLVRVFQALPDFQHNGRSGAFRNWLRKIVSQQVWRHAQHLSKRVPWSGAAWDGEYAVEVDSELNQMWESEHDRYVLTKLLELIQPEFSKSTWAAFVSVAVEGNSIAATAEALALSPNAVMIAKSRVLARLRIFGRELLDDL